MSKKRRYSMSEIDKNISILHKNVPFQITKDGIVVAEVIRPSGTRWRKCEICGENTQNIIQFPDENSVWIELILCDKCADEQL